MPRTIRAKLQGLETANLSSPKSSTQHNVEYRHETARPLEIWTVDCTWQLCPRTAVARVLAASSRQSPTLPPT
eukprot:6545126-Pyramimonas_sp.AAC.1